LLGEILCSTGRRPEAVQALRRAASLSPGDADTRSALGVVLAETGVWPRRCRIGKRRPGCGPIMRQRGTVDETSARRCSLCVIGS
jgi:hypothetical protein